MTSDIWSQYPDYDGYWGSEEYDEDKRRERLIAEAEAEVAALLGETDRTADDIAF